MAQGAIDLRMERPTGLLSEDWRVGLVACATLPLWLSGVARSGIGAIVALSPTVDSILAGTVLVGSLSLFTFDAMQNKRRGRLSPEVSRRKAGAEAMDEPTATCRAVNKAKETLRLIAERDAVFEYYLPKGAVGDPTWEMMLDLFVRQMTGRRVSVSDLCLASSGPPTTALRHITRLTERGILLRESDEHDKRRIWITLSAEAEKRICKILNS